MTVATRNTQTKIVNGPNNRTATHLSTNIVIKVGNNVIGAIKTLDVTESRGTIKMINEVGTDGHIDSAPATSVDVSGSCSRTRFDRMRIAEAFSRPFIHVGSQRLPFDIEIHDLFADSDPNNAVITVIQNVWIKDIRYTYSSDDFVIVDTMSWTAERIFSFLNNKNVVQATSNGRADPIVLNVFEQQADMGKYTGALDAAGLLNAFISG